MIMSTVSMLQELTTFGNTGRESCLQTILENADQKALFGQVPNDVATKVITRIIDLFKTTFLNEKKRMAWCVLLILCDPDKNFAATYFKRKLENSAVLNFVVGACENYPASECEASLNFLLIITSLDDKMRSHVLKRSRLLQELFTVFDASMSALDLRIAGTVLRILNAILKFTGSTDTFVELGGSLDTFVEFGGFAKLMSAFERIVALGVQQYNDTGQVTEQLNILIGRGVAAVSAYQNTAPHHLRHLLTSTIDSNLYFITAERAREYTLVLNNAYDILPDCETQVSILCHLPGSYTFLDLFITPPVGDARVQAQARNDVLEYFLLTPGPISGAGLLIKCVRKLRAVEEIRGVPSTTILENFDLMSVKIPNTRAELEKEIGEKLVYCSLPDCDISNLKRGRLEKCVRCMSVWYCGREHQVEHWKAHKTECKRVAAELQAATGESSSSVDAEVGVAAPCADSEAV